MTNCYSDDWEPDFGAEKIPKAECAELSDNGDNDSSPNPASTSNLTLKSPKLWMDNNKSDVNLGETENNRKLLTSDHEAFTLEEIVSSDLEQEDAHKQTIKPDEYEEVDSNQTSGDEIDEDSDIATGIRRLSCQDEPRGPSEEQISSYTRKKKKWRAQFFKRRRSQSFSDEIDMTDSVEVEGCEVDHTHRRLRRRIDDPDEGNLMFEQDATNVEISDLDEQMEIED